MTGRVWYQGGSTTKPLDVDKLRERFWGKVATGAPDECWPWLAYRRPFGYGQFTLSQAEMAYVGANSRNAVASRVACALTYGPRPQGVHALHSCDNPSCCNPSHLRWGSHTDNMRDAVKRRRLLFDENHHQAKLTDEQVAEVIRRARSGERVVDLAAEYDAGVRTIYGWLAGRGRGRIADQQVTS